MWPGVNTATEYVISRTVTSHTWQPTVFMAEDVAERIARTKQDRRSNLHVCASAELVQTLLAHDLVDAFWLKTHPITLAGGKRLLAAGTIPARPLRGAHPDEPP